MAKKPRAQLEADLKALKTSRAIDGWVKIIVTIVQWTGVVIVVRYAYLAIEALAGQQTAAEITVLTKVEISVALAWTAAAAGVVYGRQQKKLRKDTVERLQARIVELETALDPKRSSSKLTPRGDTRPEDVT